MIAPHPDQSNALDMALESYEDDVDTRRELLGMLLQSRVLAVFDLPWDGRSLPSTSAHMLFVSDGDNAQQAMLAVFTNPRRVEAVQTAGSQFKYPVEVDMRWALLGLPQGAGIMLNPNSERGFRITPDLAAQLRGLAEQQLAAHAAKTGAAEPRRS